MTGQRLVPIVSEPRADHYDVVIVGGAIIGSSVAWFLSDNPSFDGSILVVERDPTYQNSSTAHTNSCMRQQFSNELNVRISQFAAEFVRNFRHYLGDDPEVPELAVNHYGYMYLAGDEAFATTLRENQVTQAAFGAGTRIMSPAQIAADYPFYNLDDIICGSHNTVDEGYFDSGTMFDWWRRKARENGVEYLTNEVVGIGRSAGGQGDRVTGVTLASGETIPCGTVVNASGPRAVETARMAGLDLPVEPRKRYTFMFEAAEPLDRDLPLTIDPTGVHVRTEGSAYMAVVTRWAGHYAHNTVDHNVIVGPHHEVDNFVFACGFSGHGLQQSPAMGRGVAELIAHGRYRSLDLTPLGYDRIVRGEPFIETAII